jgi:hypothetical protein
MSKPIAVDLFCGLGGWTEGLLANGWHVRGYDIEAHEYGDEKYPGEFVLRDILQMHGSEIADADLIVSSSPCTEYSYMAMPWSLAKAKAAAIRADETGELFRKLNALFDAQFRLQREASEAKGEWIPMVVENVRGAQPWVGQARGSYGSYYLWGDVPALMPSARHMKNVTGGSWFGLNPNGTPGALNNARERHVQQGRKHSGDWVRDPTCPTRQGGQIKVKIDEGRKGPRGAWFNDNKSVVNRLSVSSSNSPARKAASAKIAKIPFALSSHIARVYLPHKREVA